MNYVVAKKKKGGKKNELNCSKEKEREKRMNYKVTKRQGGMGEKKKTSLLSSSFLSLNAYFLLFLPAFSRFQHASFSCFLHFLLVLARFSF